MQSIPQRSSPTTKLQLQKTVNSMVHQALLQGGMEAPRTLVTHVGGHNVVIHMSAAQPEPVQEEVREISAEEAEQLARRVYTEHLDQINAEEKHAKAVEVDNKASAQKAQTTLWFLFVLQRLQSKLDALKSKMALKRRREHSGSSTSSSRTSSPTAPAHGANTAFAGLQSGFLKVVSPAPATGRAAAKAPEPRLEEHQEQQVSPQVSEPCESCPSSPSSSTSAHSERSSDEPKADPRPGFGGLRKGFLLPRHPSSNSDSGAPPSSH